MLRLLPLAASLALFAAAGSLPRGESRGWWIALCSGFALVNLYAAEARAYALLALACLGIFLFGAVARETPRNLAALFAAAAAALWLHYLAIFAVAAGLAPGASRAAGFAPRSSCVVAGATFVPWLPVLARQPVGGSVLGPREAVRDGASVSSPPSAEWDAFPLPSELAPPRSALLATALVGALLVVVLARASRGDPSVRAASLFALVTLGLAFAASIGRPIAFAGRSEMAVLPVWMWGLAKAAPQTVGRPRRSGPRRGPRSRGDDRSRRRAASPADGRGGGRARGPPRAARRRGARRTRLSTCPRCSRPTADGSRLGSTRSRPATRPIPGWFTPSAPGPAEEAQLRAEMQAISPGRRLWLLLPPSHDSAGVMRVLSSAGTVRELARQNDAVLLVWSPSPPDEPPQVSPRAS